jgi:hypothetical protein
MTARTAGPWAHFGDGVVRSLGGDGILCNPPLKLGSGWREDAWADDLADEETLANATALAALPDLLEALRPFAECCDQISDEESPEEWAKFRLLVSHYRAARDAVRKAEGLEK